MQKLYTNRTSYVKYKKLCKLPKNICKLPKNLCKSCDFSVKILANKNGLPNWWFAYFSNSDLRQLSANTQ